MMQGRRGHPAPTVPKIPHAPLNMIPVYRTLEELKASSPSRKHGLSEEDEDRWRRAAVNLMITAAGSILMQVCVHIKTFPAAVTEEHGSVITALGFFHRYYAEHSMVTNDRFLMAMACLYLGGKIADFPKSSRDIIYACVDAMCTTPEESIRLRNDNEWMKITRKALNDAERALLYQLGFRFAWIPPYVVIGQFFYDKICGGTVYAFINDYFEYKREEKVRLFNLCVQLGNESAKTLLMLQYPAESIAAVCLWMAMKMMKLTRSPPPVFDPKTGAAKQWYFTYGLESEDVDIIADQITKAVVDDVEAMQEIVNGAVKVSKTEFIHPLGGTSQGGGGGGVNIENGAGR